MPVKIIKTEPVEPAIDFQEEEEILNAFKPVQYTVVLACGKSKFTVEVEIPTFGYQPTVTCPICKNEIPLPAFTDRAFGTTDPKKEILSNRQRISSLYLGASFSKVHTYIRFEHLSNLNTPDYWFRAFIHYQRRHLRENHRTNLTPLHSSSI